MARNYQKFDFFVWSDFLKYKKGKRFGLSEVDQSLIFWELRNFSKLDVIRQDIIVCLCTDISPNYCSELLQAITTDKSVLAIEMQNNIAQNTLSKYIKKFYVSYLKLSIS